MAVSRRNFLKVAVAGAGGVVAFGFDLAPAYTAVRELKIARTTETRRTPNVRVQRKSDWSQSETPAPRPAKCSSAARRPHHR